MGDQVLSYAEFLEYLEREVGIELPKSAGDLVIGVDIELDSVTMLEMVVAIEDLGAELPADLFLTAKSIGEVYETYLVAVGSAADDPGRDEVDVP
jgi:acyl carrier protein